MALSIGKKKERKNLNNYGTRVAPATRPLIALFLETSRVNLFENNDVPLSGEITGDCVRGPWELLLEVTETLVPEFSARFAEIDGGGEGGSNSSVCKGQRRLYRRKAGESQAETTFTTQQWENNALGWGNAEFYIGLTAVERILAI